MEILIILGLILLNGLLAMSEMALVSARKTRLEASAKKGNQSARRALQLSGDPGKSLSTIQVGITLIGILTGLFSGEAFSGELALLLAHVAWLAPYSVLVAKLLIVMVVTYLTLILGELVPKRIGLNYAEKISMWMARPMMWLAAIGAPFVWLLSKSTYMVLMLLRLHRHEDNKVTEEEIKAVVQEGFEGGEVQEVEQDIVGRVFHLGDRTVGAFMTHRSDLIWIDTSHSNQTTSE